MEQRAFLRKFGVPEDIILNVILINTKDNYYWSVEAVDDKILVYCAINRNDLYDGDDRTLSEKIVTSKNLFFRNKEIDHTLVIEEYVNSFETDHKAYVITSLKDDFCMYEKL